MRGVEKWKKMELRKKCPALVSASAHLLAAASQEHCLLLVLLHPGGSLAEVVVVEQSIARNTIVLHEYSC